MNANRGFIVLVVWVASASMPGLASAQIPRFDLPLFVGQKVEITTADGSKTQGTVTTLTPASVVVGDGATRSSLAVADVLRIQIPDSTRNGAVIGAVSLGLVGGLAGAIGGAGVDLFNEASDVNGTYDSIAGTTFLLGAAAGATVGALLGAAIDGARVRTIYERPAGRIAVSLRPILSNAGKGVGVRVRW